MGSCSFTKHEIDLLQISILICINLYYSIYRAVPLFIHDVDVNLRKRCYKFMIWWDDFKFDDVYA